jgi:hypothetical protein
MSFSLLELCWIGTGNHYLHKISADRLRPSVVFPRACYDLSARSGQLSGVSCAMPHKIPQALVQLLMSGYILHLAAKSTEKVRNTL